MSAQNMLPPGEMVEPGGFRLHALVRGQGTPVVVLEAGLGGYALQFAQIQPGVSGFCRGCRGARQNRAPLQPRQCLKSPAWSSSGNRKIDKMSTFV